MKKTFPKLYSRTSTGKIQEWQIFAEDDYFYTVSGQQDGQQVTSEPNICVGKNVGKANETSAHLQAVSEAQSKYEKKLKADYKESVADIDKLTFFEPMLAKKFNDRRDKVIYPVIVDRKYNGSRVIAKASGLYTRKGEVYHSIPHIAEALKPLFKKYPNLILDGEAYNHEYRFKLNEMMSLVRQSVNVTPEDLAASQAIVRFYVYDGLGFTGDCPVELKTEQFIRRKQVQKLIDKLDSDYIVAVDGDIAQSEAEILELYQEYVEDGYEGAMVRIDGPYKNGRSSDLLKIKPTDDAEFEILAIEEGSGNWSGKAKRIELKMENGKTFFASFKGNMQQAEEMLNNKKKYIGQIVTCYFNGLTGLGIPNYCQFDYSNWKKS